MEIDTNSVANMAAELFDTLQLSWNSLRMTITTGERGPDTRTRSPAIERQASADSLKERNSVQDGQIPQTPLSQKEKDANSVATMAADLIDSLQFSWNSLKMTATAGERLAETRTLSSIVEKQVSSDTIKGRQVQDELKPQRPYESVEPVVNNVKSEDNASLGEKEPTSCVCVVASSETAGPAGEGGQKELKSCVRAEERSETVGLPVKTANSLELSWNSLRTTIKTGERSAETQVRSPIVERLPSSDNVTERNIQDGNIPVGLSESLQKDSCASDLGEDCASPIAKESPSKCEGIALSSNLPEANLEPVQSPEHEDLPIEECSKAKLERPCVKKLNADLLERNSSDLHKTWETFCAEKQLDPVPGTLHEFTITDWNCEDGRIPLGRAESLQVDLFASVDFKTDLIREFASPGDKESTWNVLNAPHCNPSSYKTGAGTGRSTTDKEGFLALYNSTCDGCGKATLIRSGRVLDGNLCLRCVEMKPVERNHSTTIYPFYFAHPTFVGTLVDGSTPGHLLSDLSETTETETSQRQAKESGLPTDKGGLVAKMGELGFSSQKLNAELLVKNSIDSHTNFDDLCAEDEWDPISGELQELGFYDSRMNRS